MKNIVVASMKAGAGKTSIIVGIERVLGKKIGYMKPFGDRLLYKKKRLWDYDAALVTDIFKLSENPEDITIGFEHAKLRYMFDADGVKGKLLEISGRTSKGKDMLFVEGGMDLSYGASVNLDSLKVAKSLDARVVMVVSGTDGQIADDIAFLKNYVDTSRIHLAGIVINKIQDMDDFRNTHLDGILKVGLPVIGLIPYVPELAHFTVGYLCESLFGKVVAGAGGLGNVVENIFVGAMSADAAANSPLFKKSNKLIITSGDRSDMIVNAIETNAIGIVLTNNLLPPANIISKASERNVPMFLVPTDTFQVAKQIDNIEPLLTKDDNARISLIERLVRDNLDLKELA